MIENFFTFFICTFFPLCAFSQSATVYGKITNESNERLGSVSIKYSGSAQVQLSDKEGNYALNIPSDIDITITFSSVGYENYSKKVNLKTGQQYPLYVVLISQTYLIDSITIEDHELRDQPSMVKIDPNQFDALPSASGGVEAILKVLGASSNNELSSQYSVRGGNDFYYSWCMGLIIFSWLRNSFI
jgi:hypothetical protein